MRNMTRKYGPKLALIGAGTLATIGQVFAAVPEAFTDAVADVTADGVSMAGALVGVAAAVSVVLLAVAYVKKLRSVGK